MAPATSNGHAAEPSPAAQIPTAPVDLDTLMPGGQPRIVRIEGVEYRVRQMIHLTEAEEEDLRRLEQRLNDAIASTEPDSYERARRSAFDVAFWLVRALVPDLPEQVRRRIRLDQAWVIAGVGRQATTENPPLADTGTGSDAAEANSRPVSVDSMAAIPVTSPA